jgi:hypothetical protein
VTIIDAAGLIFAAMLGLSLSAGLISGLERLMIRRRIPRDG